MSMINCPKCGFLQPKDKYCANCGVDMLNFKKIQPSLTRQILSNWIFQVFLVIGFILILDHFLHRTLPPPFVLPSEQRQQINTQKKQSPKTPPSSSTLSKSAKPIAPTNNKLPIEEPQTNNHSKKATAPVTATPSSTTLAVNNSLPSEESRASSEISAEKQISQNRHKLRLNFIQIQKSVLQEWLNNNRIIREDSSQNIQVAQVSDLKEKIMAATEKGILKSIDESMSLNLKQNESQLFFKGGHDDASGLDLGLTFRITAQATSASDQSEVHDTSSTNLFSIQLQIQRHLLPSVSFGGGPQTLLQEQLPFNLSQGTTSAADTGFIIAGLLPHRPLEPEELRIYSSAGLLQILTLPAFQAQHLEFVVLIQAD